MTRPSAPAGEDLAAPAARWFTWQLVCFALAGLTTIAAQDQPPPFRSVSNGVTVDVSVRQRGRPIIGLKADDFEILDNGVAQTVADVSYGKLPIDVTVALDISNSVSGDLIGRLRAAVEVLRGRLAAADRLKLMTFNMRVSRLVDFTDRRVDTKAVFDRIAAAGSTSFFDTIAVALTSAAPVDRRQLVVLFSDGQDTTSVTSPARLLDLARRSTPAVTFVLPATMVNVSSALGPPSGRADAGTATPLGTVSGASIALSRTAGVPTIVRDLATETGGTVVLSTPNDNISSTFASILDDFRSTYVLHFSPAGSPAAGFHTLEVRIRKPGVFDVRARRGYEQ